MILVTGGAGYIGSHVNAMLADNGIRTVVLDDLSLGHRELVISGDFIIGDIGDQNTLGMIFKKYNIEHVVHLAAFTDVDDSIVRPMDYYDNNVTKTLRLLDSMIEHDVRSFIFSSTSAIYADEAAMPVGEDGLKAPICPYARSKLYIEEVLEDYRIAYGLKYVAFRYFNAAGADPQGRVGEWHEPEPHLIPVILDVAAGHRGDIKIFGMDYPTPDGTCVRDFIHVVDIASAHVQALRYLDKGGKSGIFNLGYGTGYSVAEVIDATRRITGREIVAIPSARRPGDVAISIADSTKAKTILGWKPAHANLDNIITTAWEWHQRMNVRSTP